ncbi:hypothetical protein [Vibrio superstes]|uniref:Uncharacterized protein n=1 Tax=Vibrio superstes NBRC 103154 TaxID=1219062 RepID=A0A511QME2_9VIBR|nr:hypothetical protein [Vibrio superstes]GEM78498.1 hypothetical protein VSU01S_07430 [Vibrio superstes NBRC 103154]
MINVDIKLAMNDNEGKYNITISSRIIYSVEQSEGIDGINQVFDAIQEAMSITLKTVSNNGANISMP